MSNRKEPKKKQNSSEPVQVELALLQVFWDVARDNLSDYFVSRADVHRLNVLTAFNKPDVETDKIYV